MRISIGHVSRYTYGEPVQYSIQTLRLTPPNFNGQRVIEWLITAPGFEKRQSFRDSFGNVAHLVSFTGSHDESVVLAKGVVETEDRAGLVAGLQRSGAGARVPARNAKDARRAKRSAISRTKRARSPIDQRLSSLDECGARCGRLPDRHDVEHTNAETALAAGRGVCQDHAHVFIAAARCLGVPARYVNGYFVSGDDEPAEAHHAWAEVWVDGLGWVGFDAANRMCPTDHYVRLATGLDAASAAPIRGTRRGGTNEALDVIVEVQQQNTQQ